MPRRVLIRLTASAPASAAAAAIGTTSVTFGVSLAMTGSGHRDRTRRTSRPTAAALMPRSRPWLTFGQEMFSSTAARPGSAPSRSAIATNWSSSSPAMLAITAVPTVRR